MITQDEISRVLPSEGPYTLGQAWFAVRNWCKLPYPYQKRHTVQSLAPLVALVITLASLTVHFIVASMTNCSVNFQRGGSIISLTAAALYAVLDWHKNDAALPSGSRTQPFKLLDPKILLPLLGVVGTLIWGYGDLIPLWSSKCLG